jgi:hypothetical protein
MSDDKLAALTLLLGGVMLILVYCVYRWHVDRD